MQYSVWALRQKDSTPPAPAFCHCSFPKYNWIITMCELPVPASPRLGKWLSDLSNGNRKERAEGAELAGGEGAAKGSGNVERTLVDNGLYNPSN